MNNRLDTKEEPQPQVLFAFGLVTMKREPPDLRYNQRNRRPDIAGSSDHHQANALFFDGHIAFVHLIIKVKPYWKPLQPPPVIYTRNLDSGYLRQRSGF